MANSKTNGKQEQSLFLNIRRPRDQWERVRSILTKRLNMGNGTKNNLTKNGVGKPPINQSNINRKTRQKKARKAFQDEEEGLKAPQKRGYLREAEGRPCKRRTEGSGCVAGIEPIRPKRHVPAPGRAEIYLGPKRKIHQKIINPGTLGKKKMLPKIEGAFRR